MQSCNILEKMNNHFIETAIGWIREVENSYAPKLTDFLDPRERFIVESLIEWDGFIIDAYGALSK